MLPTLLGQPAAAPSAHRPCRDGIYGLLENRRRVGPVQASAVGPVQTAVPTRHRMAIPGAGALVRTDSHRAALEQVVLGAFTTARPCTRKANRPPGPAALAAAAALRADVRDGQEVVVDLGAWARAAEGAR